MGAKMVDPQGKEYPVLAAEQSALRDGLFAACLICRRLARTGERLVDLHRRTPEFGLFRAELPLEGSRGELMEALIRTWPQAQPGQEGIRVRFSGGWAWLRPASDRPSLRIRTEGNNVELAAELCELVRSEAKRLDGGGK
jgi:mannose-1-phosphate guanylyltransferase/phosphomannomutase